jgi:N utilization substance protein B
MNIHWYDDFYMANNLVIKFIQSITTDWNEETAFPKLLGEDDAAKNEDIVFVKKLLSEATTKDAEIEKIISAFLTNWEPERIALLDMLIMKLAVVEFLYFPSIPVKATLNEYIEISKEYSTPKSKIFINGVLDKIIRDLKEKGKLNKSGRGLKEN